ncbi:MAG: carboxypeptidase-like regulatory domain-containing protein [Pyrinomonadaceae bacterium]
MPKLNTPKRRHARGALAAASALLLALALPFVAHAQKEVPATVSGRITDGERGVPGVTVTIFANDPAQRFRTAARGKTDVDGRFSLTGIQPGRYQILPVAPAYVVAGLMMNYPPGRPLTLLAGEEVKDIDFQMEPGAVITGRVTDADGNPVINEPVTVSPAEQNAGQPRFQFDQRDHATDDRGVYRVYGLPPGRYRVSVGRAGEVGAVSIGRRKLFRRTFHPDAVEQAQARVVEVKTGIESTDIDITVGRALKTYKVAGRFVTADTGQPVPNVSVGYGTIDPRGRRLGGFGAGTVTNARGEFQTGGIAPGRYVVYVMTNQMNNPQEVAEFYSEPTPFEVTDADVAGLVVKLKRGAVVSGVVAVEGVADRAAAAQMLAAVRVHPWVESYRENAAMPGSPMRPVTVGADGSFRVTGLMPGKLRLGTMNDAVKGLTLTRVELNGANVIGGFDVAAGAQIAGVRLVLTYGSAALVGQTTFVNGTLPPGGRVMAAANLTGSTPGTRVSRTVEVDARGYFRIEGLPAGEYEVIVHVFFFNGGPGRARRSEPQRVVLGDGVEAKVAPVIDFNK